MANLGISGISDASLIASGGSALVYEATDDNGIPVAVKLMRGIRGAEVARRFEREQQAAQRLQEHPHIINVRRSGVSAAGEPFLVMPLMRRGSLADELDTGVFSVDQAVHDTLQAAEAIDFAHRRGVLHRDLKPGNLLRTDDGDIVVTDFGIARVVDAGISSATVGAATPLYAAPELLSENDASVQSDVYGLGAVLYALLAGAPAFSDSANIWATIGRIRSESPPPIALVPAPIMRVIEQAMAKDPSDRPPTAHQFHQNLLAAIDADADWAPPSPAAVTQPAPGPGPASVPVVTIPGHAPPPAATRSTPDEPSRTGALDTPLPPPAPARTRVGTKAAAALGAIAIVALLAWLAITRLFGGSSTTSTEIAEPVDTSLPPPTVIATDGQADTDDQATDTDDASENPIEGGDAGDTDDDQPGDEQDATDSELVRFAGQHFRADFPLGWSVIRADVDVGYGFRSQFSNTGDRYLTIDTTPPSRRTGTETIAESARSIASTIASASAVTTTTVNGRELHSFTFRNNRGINSIDIFFSVDGHGYAIVAGSNTDTDAMFDVARQVAATVQPNE